MNRSLLVAAAAATVTLAAPVAATAHPSVYETTARTVPSPAPSPITAGDLIDQRRYVFSNHGYTAVLRETNGVTTMGGLNYAALPGVYRNQASTTANSKEAWYLEGGTGVQVHATCQGVAALSSYENIGSWQGTDPFYGYIPFQKAAAGFEDDPADWIPVVKTLTGVDLATVADPAAACTGLGGTYTPADAYNNPPTAANPLAPWTTLSASTIADATKPLVAEITDLKAKVVSLETAKAAAERATAQAQTALQVLADKAAAAEQATAAANAQLKAATTPLGIALDSTSLKVAALSSGVAVRLTGPAGEKAHVRILLPASKAKAHKLRSRVLASTTTTIAAGGTTVTLKSGSAARTAMAKLSGPTNVTVDVAAGGRSVLTTARLAR
ncbi:MAG: hypothetical protein JHC84_00550 [Solirubrobacteraceae bacterium]|nr:hypothetical protein [Solirubrobacteraceae bacterium]